MGRSVKNPKKHIVSCRINEWELEALQHLTAESGTSVSELLRESLLTLCNQQESDSRRAA